MYKKVFTSLKIPNAESIKSKLLKHSFYFREKLIENFKLVFLGTVSRPCTQWISGTFHPINLKFSHIIPHYIIYNVEYNLFDILNRWIFINVIKDLLPSAKNIISSLAGRQFLIFQNHEKLVRYFEDSFSPISHRNFVFFPLQWHLQLAANKQSSAANGDR